MTTNKIVLDGGKYTVVNELNDGGSLYALRNGHAWRTLSGDGLVLAMYLEIEELRAELEKHCKNAVEQFYHEWFALVYEEFEDDGVILLRHENTDTNGWWAHYDVEFSYCGKVYGFKYRKHTSPNCSDSDITEELHEKGTV